MAEGRRCTWNLSEEHIPWPLHIAAELEEHSSCLEANKRNMESSPRFLGAEGTRKWEAHSDQVPYDGETPLEGCSPPFLSQRLKSGGACHRAPLPGCGLSEVEDRILREGHTLEPRFPFWVADIPLQGGGTTLVVVLLPLRPDDRRGEGASRPCLEACTPHPFCG